MEIKPCPFCGGEAEVYSETTSQFSVHCIKCNAEQCLVLGRDNAIKAWNTRHQEVPSVKEICICAAIKMADGYLARGHRHGDCAKHINEKYKYEKKKVDWSDHIQGFITSKNRFVTREEGRKLQDAAGIKSVEGYRGNTLFSEDLY